MRRALVQGQPYKPATLKILIQSSFSVRARVRGGTAHPYKRDECTYRVVHCEGTTETRRRSTARPGDTYMRQGTGYAYGDGEDCISYKCEGCGQRVRVTPAQARHFRGAFTACSKSCILKAQAHRSQQKRRESRGLASRCQP